MQLHYTNIRTLTDSEELVFYISNADQVVMFGQSQDLGVCSINLETGDKCNKVINKSLGKFCEVHSLEKPNFSTNETNATDYTFLQSPTSAPIYHPITTCQPGTSIEVLGKEKSLQLKTSSKSDNCDTVVPNKNKINCINKCASKEFINFNSSLTELNKCKKDINKMSCIQNEIYSDNENYTRKKKNVSENETSVTNGNLRLLEYDSNKKIVKSSKKNHLQNKKCLKAKMNLREMSHGKRDSTSKMKNCILHTPRSRLLPYDKSNSLYFERSEKRKTHTINENTVNDSILVDGVVKYQNDKEEGHSVNVKTSEALELNENIEKRATDLFNKIITDTYDSISNVLKNCGMKCTFIIDETGLKIKNNDDTLEFEGTCDPHFSTKPLTESLTNEENMDNRISSHAFLRKLLNYFVTNCNSSTLAEETKVVFQIVQILDTLSEFLNKTGSNKCNSSCSNIISDKSSSEKSGLQIEQLPQSSAGVQESDILKLIPQSNSQIFAEINAENLRTKENIPECGTEQEENIPECGTEQEENIPECGTEQEENIPECGTEQEENIPECGTEQEENIPECGTEQEENIPECGTEQEENIPECGTEQEVHPNNNSCRNNNRKKSIAEVCGDEINNSMQQDAKTEIKMNKSSENDKSQKYTYEVDNFMDKYFPKISTREIIPLRILKAHMIPCMVVKCLKCRYLWFSSFDLCKLRGHKIQLVKGKKYFFKCRVCKNRTVSPQVKPLGSCMRCGNSEWENATVAQFRR
ncbi:uncharacterized protein LOC142322635 [Lycorma delicatula]|uniref:uncharacterized protein LOC142322635 n=1 Tax=Lycorma delicatula TaxID=130591 RepID=UPI003F5196B5